MTTLLIIAILGMSVYIFKTLINIASFAIYIVKDKTLNQSPNKLEKEYQFIKGLY